MMFQKQLSPYNLNENLWQPGGETHISAFTEEKNKGNAIYMIFFFCQCLKDSFFSWSAKCTSLWPSCIICCLVFGGKNGDNR